MADAVAGLGELPADIVTDRDRAGGRGYYRDLCFKVSALVSGVPTEIGDGGFTDWTAKLLSNGKERLLISGYGLDRLAALVDGQQWPPSSTASSERSHLRPRTRTPATPPTSTSHRSTVRSLV
jgi:hypothetical protein